MHASSEKKASQSDSLPITNPRSSLLALYSAENTVVICCRGGLMATRNQAA